MCMSRLLFYFTHPERIKKSSHSVGWRGLSSIMIRIASSRVFFFCSIGEKEKEPEGVH